MSLILIQGCAPVMPQLPEELVSHNEETVFESSEQRVTFPPFFADHFKQDPQNISFHTQMKGKSFVIQTSCAWKSPRKINCTLQNESAHYKLVLGLNRQGVATGHLVGEDIRLEIRTLFEDRNGTVHPEPLAFAITKDGKAIAVLDNTAGMRYWYRDRSPTQELGLAAAWAVLLNHAEMSASFFPSKR